MPHVLGLYEGLQPGTRGTSSQSAGARLGKGEGKALAVKFPRGPALLGEGTWSPDAEGSVVRDSVLAGTHQNNHFGLTREGRRRPKRGRGITLLSPLVPNR